jgi:hypothetical protein
MSFAWFIARRYLTARRRQAFISLISAVSIVGVGVGVMALIIALALMTGVQGELRDRSGSTVTSTFTNRRVSDVVRGARCGLRVTAAPAIVGSMLQSTAALLTASLGAQGDRSRSQTSPTFTAPCRAVA